MRYLGLDSKSVVLVAFGLLLNFLTLYSPYILLHLTRSSAMSPVPNVLLALAILFNLTTLGVVTKQAFTRATEVSSSTPSSTKHPTEISYSIQLELADNFAMLGQVLVALGRIDGLKDCSVFARAGQDGVKFRVPFSRSPAPTTKEEEFQTIRCSELITEP